MKKFAAAIAICSLSSQAFAEQKVAVHPVQVGDETVRYMKGVPTLDLQRKGGAIQVTPLGLYHGSLIFSVAVYNGSGSPTNFGIENFNARTTEQLLPVFSREELVRRAENCAFWSKFGLALVGGLAAGVAASQRSTYRSYWHTPRGTYVYRSTYPSAYGQIQSAALTAGTVYGIAEIQAQLDATREALGDRVIQLTTLDPGESYSGVVVLAKIKTPRLPQPISLTVNWNDERYPFSFLVNKPGTPAPVFTALTPSRSSEVNSVRDMPSPGAKPLPTMTQASTTAGKPGQGRQVSPGVWLLPAKTPSGECLLAPDDYRGAGSLSKPAITDATPRCPTT